MQPCVVSFAASRNNQFFFFSFDFQADGLQLSCLQNALNHDADLLQRLGLSDVHCLLWNPEGYPAKDVVDALVESGLPEEDAPPLYDLAKALDERSGPTDPRTYWMLDWSWADDGGWFTQPIWVGLEAVPQAEAFVDVCDRALKHHELAGTELCARPEEQLTSGLPSSMEALQWVLARVGERVPRDIHDLHPTPPTGALTALKDHWDLAASLEAHLPLGERRRRLGL